MHYPMIKNAMAIAVAGAAITEAFFIHSSIRLNKAQLIPNTPPSVFNRHASCMHSSSITPLTRQQMVKKGIAESNINNTQRAAIIEMLSEKETPSFYNLTTLLPKEMSPLECVETLREISCSELNTEIERTMNADLWSLELVSSSSVQIATCFWKGDHSDALKEIQIFGYAHGFLKTPEETALDLRLKLNADQRTNRELYVEQNLGDHLMLQHIIHKGFSFTRVIDVQDHCLRKDKSFFSEIISLVNLFKLMMSLNLLPRLAGGKPISLEQYIQTAYHIQPDVDPDCYDRSIQSTDSKLPEAIEIDAHKTLLPSDAKALDKNTPIHHRSAYMAGYLAAIVELKEESINIRSTQQYGSISKLADIVLFPLRRILNRISPDRLSTDLRATLFVCGGAHLPRIASCLAFESRENMPASLKEYFDIGYKRAKHNHGRDFYYAPREKLCKSFKELRNG